MWHQKNFNNEFSIRLRLTNYTVFNFHRCNMSGDAPITPCLIFIGVICQETHQLHRVHFKGVICHVSTEVNVET